MRKHGSPSKWSAFPAAALALLACFAPTCAQAPHDDNCLVGVYYYPWYANDFHGRHYLRQHLVPPQPPQLGEYNDRDPEVIRQHLQWSRDAAVDFWAASWWGPGGREDRTLRDHIFKHPDLAHIKIAIHYETAGRTRDFSDYSAIGPDFAYLARTYFAHPNYLKIEGKPVIFVYLTRVLARKGTLKNSVDAMRSAAAKEGYELYLIGDHAFGAPPDDADGLELLDAITNYDIYGAMAAKGYAGQSGVDRYTTDQTRWRDIAHRAGAGFVPAVAPGFNDKGVRGGHPPLSRKLTVDEDFGSLFRALLRGARPLTDPAIGNMLMVTSWNEWHEDTQIEPVQSAPPTSADDSGENALTRLHAYEGYGTRYLDILREEIRANVRAPSSR